MPPEPQEADLAFFAIGESDRGDVSEHIDEFIREAIDRDFDASR